MTYIDINGTRYPAEIVSKLNDKYWNGRDSKAITLDMAHAEAAGLFVDGLSWSAVFEHAEQTNAEGQTVTPDPKIFDYSDWCVAGPITDNRDGSVTVKMGKITAEEMMQELLEVLNIELP